MKSISNILILVILFFASSLLGSELEHKLRSGIKISYEINRLKLAAEIHNRLDKNFSEIDKSFLDFDVEYAITKRFKIFTSYRFLQKPENNYNNWETLNRAGVGFKYDYKRKKLKASVKARYQNYFDIPGIVYEDTKVIRIRPEISYKLSKLNITPYISTELFYQMGMGNDFNFNQMRPLVGSKYKFNKQHSLDIFYMLDLEFDDSDKSSIFGIIYSFKLKHKK